MEVRKRSRVFEHLFGKPLDKARPGWLKNPRTSSNLDGYCEYESVAFEYNGVQHYKYHSGWHESIEDLENQKFKDAIKLTKCIDMDMLLVVISYTESDKVTIDRFIINKLNNNGFSFDIKELSQVDYYT